VRRVLIAFASLVGVLLAVSIVTFAIQDALPGDPAEIRVGKRDDLSSEQRAELVAQARSDLGLDQPLVVQYVVWLGNALRLDFGTSEGGQPARDAVLERLVPSLELALVALLVSLPIAAVLAVASVRRGRRVLPKVLDGVTIVGFVVPSFWLGIILVIVFAVWLGWLPSGGYVPFREDPVEHLKLLAMPVITLAVPTIALYYHYMRQSLRESLDTQYVRTARAKGLSESRMLYRHALPNALLPSLTILGIQFGQLLGGVVVVERVFNWSGVGGLLLYSVERQDYNVLVFCVLAIAAAYVVVSTLVDILYGVVDPRVRRA
jgi:peptide/nickel transport system permease protein